jgi:CRP/FNR family transcriptional regulator
MFELIKPEKVDRMDFLFGHLYADSDLELPAYEMLYREGQSCDSIYILKEGSVTLNKKNKEGKYSFLCKKYSGAILGITSLFTGNAYTNTAITMEKSRVFRLSSIEFRKLLLRNQHLHSDFIRPLAEDIEQYQKSI